MIQHFVNDFLKKAFKIYAKTILFFEMKMSKAIYMPEIKNKNCSEIETVNKDGTITAVSAPVTLDLSCEASASCVGTKSVLDRQEQYNNSVILSECYEHFLKLAQDSYKSVDIDGQPSMYELEPLIESLIIAAEYAFKSCNKKIFTTETSLNRSSIDYRLKCVVESVVAYLNNHNDHSLVTTNNDILQLIIKLCQAKFDILKPSLGKLVKQIYKTALSFCGR